MGKLPVINLEVPWHRVNKHYSRITDEGLRHVQHERTQRYESVPVSVVP